MAEQPPLSRIPDEDTDGWKLHVLNSDLLSIGIPEFIKKPSDLLDDKNLELLRVSLHLDGIVPIPRERTREEHLARRQLYFSKLDEKLRERTIAGYHDNLSVPADFRYLMELCDAIEGPGLGQHRYTTGYAFVSEFPDDANWVDLAVQQSVFEIDNEGKVDIPYSHKDRWEVAAGFCSGDERGGFLMFCRDEEEEEGKPWAWRYGLDTTNLHHDECDDMYDDIPSFLRFFAHYEEEYLNSLPPPRCWQ